MPDEEVVPVVVKKVKKGHAHHGGAWKVAYADFVTAMMALFIVLWVMSQSEETKVAVAGYFRDPAGFSNKSINLLDGKSNELLNMDLDEIRRREMEREELKKLGEKISEELAKNPDFSELLDQVTFEIIDEGLRIELVDGLDDIFFEVGTTVLNDRAKMLIRKIGSSLARLPNKIVVEGHTDSRPFPGNGQGYTNFDLSAGRANAARQELVFSGMNELKIDEVRGYADRRLRDQDDPYSLVNRRISIIVKYSLNS